MQLLRALQVALVCLRTHLPMQVDVRDVGSIPGGGHSNPLQYFCLENPMDRGVWQAMAHRVAKSWTGLKQLSMHT